MKEIGKMKRENMNEMRGKEKGEYEEYMVEQK